MESDSFLLIAYDIANDRRRVKVHKLLTGFGVQVQESVFECVVEEADRNRLLNRLSALGKRGDNIRIYHLCASCRLRIQDHNGNLEPPPPEIYLG